MDKVMIVVKQDNLDQNDTSRRVNNNTWASKDLNESCSSVQCLRGKYSAHITRRGLTVLDLYTRKPRLVQGQLLG